MVLRPKGQFHRFLQGAHSCIWLSFYYVYQVPRPIDSLLSLSMREGETLKIYSDRYWKMFNEIDGDFDNVAIGTFKVGLPTEYGLRKSLTSKPVTSVHQLMDWIDKYKGLKKTRNRGKEKLRLSFKR